MRNKTSNLISLRLPLHLQGAKEDIIDFFAMTMGALVGLVLFMFLPMIASLLEKLIPDVAGDHQLRPDASK